jgi:transcriptional regulator with XRE-family HTH domain
MYSADRLKKLRKELRLTQIQMSEKLNIEQSTYSKYETNKSHINLHLLQKLQTEFGIDPNEFLSKSDANFQNQLSSISKRKKSAGEEDLTVLENILNANLAYQQVILKNQQIIIEMINSLSNNP